MDLAAHKPTGNQVKQWFIDRRIMPLWALLGAAIGLSIVAICRVLGISAEFVLFGVAMFALGIGTPREVTRLQGLLRRFRQSPQQ